MPKQAIKIIGFAILACCLLAACTLPTVQLDPDRQSFREALMQIMELENMTVDATASIIENDTIIFASEKRMEWNGERAYMTGPTTVNGQAMDVTGVWAEGRVILVIGDKYKSFKPTESMMSDMSGYGPEMTDYFIAKILKDMPGDFRSDSGNVTISMGEADIPAEWNKKINTMFSSMVEWSEKETFRDIFVTYFGQTALREFPIADNVRLLNMLYTAKVENSIATSSSLSLVIAGTDKAGAERVVTLNCTASVSRIGDTTPANIDIEGKPVTLITKEDYNALSRSLLKLGWQLM